MKTADVPGSKGHGTVAAVETANANNDLLFTLVFILPIGGPFSCLLHKVFHIITLLVMYCALIGRYLLAFLIWPAS